MENILEVKKYLIDYSVGSIEKSDIDWIICKCFNISRMQILSLKSKPRKRDVKKAVSFVKKRMKGVPLSHIFRCVNFCGFDFYVDKNVLSPRFETEELVDFILKKVNCGSGLDIGSGSGAISISLNKLNENIKMLGIDISNKALKVANKNKKNLGADGVVFKKSDLFDRVEGQFDFIVSNPPYIKRSDINDLDIEVKKYDPMLALDGGEDGLDFYRQIIQNAPKFLNEKGLLVFEIGYNQGNAVSDLMKKDFTNIEIIKDYTNNDRVVLGEKL